MDDRTIVFEFFLYGNLHPTYEAVTAWLEGMMRFDPKRIRYNLKKRRYNTKAYEEVIKSAVSRSNFTIEISEKWFESECKDHWPRYVSIKYRRECTCFRATTILEDYEKNEEGLLSRFQSYFQQYGGLIGYVFDEFDQWRYQNAYSKADLEQYGLSLDGVAFFEKEIWDSSERIDKHYSFPGHTDFYGEIDFHPSYRMWFGPDIYTFFSNEELETFQDCAENTDLGNGYRRIYLYKNISDYNLPENRARQWAFRNQLNMCRRINDMINKEGFKPKDKDSAVDGGVIILRGGPFPHGGDFLYKEFIDSAGKRCMESEAAGYVYCEQKGNIVLSKGRVLFENKEDTDLD